MQAFFNKAAPFHAGDLFDIETCAMDISQYARVLAPHLALKGCQPPPATSSGAGVPEEPMDCSEEDSSTQQIAPLFEMIGRLHCLVDNHIHLQQAAGTTKVGYNAYYSHKTAQLNGLSNYGGTRATRGFLIHDHRET